jgi:hypothetical protein
MKRKEETFLLRVNLGSFFGLFFSGRNGKFFIHETGSLVITWSDSYLEATAFGVNIFHTHTHTHNTHKRKTHTQSEEPPVTRPNERGGI